MKYVLLALLAYLLYKLVFNFIIPVYKASRKIKEQFRQFQEQMNMHQQPGSTSATPSPAQERPPQKEYIDFEEIK